MSTAPRVSLRRAAVAAIVSAALVGACSRSEPARRTVAVSIFPLYDITKRIAGDRAEVVLVLPPGRTTHFFDPTPRESAMVARASVFFGVGLALDGWMAQLVQGAGGGRAQVFDVGPLVDPRLVPEAILALDRRGSGNGGNAGPPVMDPHFWLDPLRMQRACDIVVDALRTFDPEGSPAYRARAEEVKRSLAQLDEEARGRSARWRGKRIVTAHGSLFYFSARYGPEVVAVVEPLAGREPSPRYVARVLSRIKETGAVAVFAENQLDRGPAQAIATEAGRRPATSSTPWAGSLPPTATRLSSVRSSTSSTGPSSDERCARHTGPRRGSRRKDASSTASRSCVRSEASSSRSAGLTEEARRRSSRRSWASWHQARARWRSSAAGLAAARSATCRSARASPPISLRRPWSWWSPI